LWFRVYIVFRLKKLQESMVGGERVNDRELQERRSRKKKAAERRLNALARALATVETEDGPNLVLGVYDDIQEELRAKNEALKKYRQKVYYIIYYYGIHTLQYNIGYGMAGRTTVLKCILLGIYQFHRNILYTVFSFETLKESIINRLFQLLSIKYL